MEKIISDTWNYERFCSPKTAARMAKAYFASCLMDKDFACVSEQDGKAVGIIICKDERAHRTQIKYTFRFIFATISLLLSKEGRKIVKMFKGFAELDKQLLAESQQSFEGEVVFFAIQSNQRGTGVGRELFTRAQNYMQMEKIKNFYLYTDVTCNYGFYEHKGMKKINEKSFSLKPYLDQDMSFFLYSYSF